MHHRRSAVRDVEPRWDEAHARGRVLRRLFNRRRGTWRGRSFPFQWPPRLHVEPADDGTDARLLAAATGGGLERRAVAAATLLPPPVLPRQRRRGDRRRTLGPAVRH